MLGSSRGAGTRGAGAHGDGDCASVPVLVWGSAGLGVWWAILGMGRTWGASLWSPLGTTIYTLCLCPGAKMMDTRLTQSAWHIVLPFPPEHHHPRLGSGVDLCPFCSLTKCFSPQRRPPGPRSSLLDGLMPHRCMCSPHKQEGQGGRGEL